MGPRPLPRSPPTTEEGPAPSPQTRAAPPAPDPGVPASAPAPRSWRLRRASRRPSRILVRPPVLSALRGLAPHFLSPGSPDPRPASGPAPPVPGPGPSALSPPPAPSQGPPHLPKDAGLPAEPSRGTWTELGPGVSLGPRSSSCGSVPRAPGAACPVGVPLHAPGLRGPPRPPCSRRGGRGTPQTASPRGQGGAWFRGALGTGAPEAAHASGAGGAAFPGAQVWGRGGVGGGTRRPGLGKTWELTSPEKFQTRPRRQQHMPTLGAGDHLPDPPKQRKPLRPGGGGLPEATGQSDLRIQSCPRPTSFTFIVIVPAGSGKGRNSAPPSAPPS